MKSLQQTIKKYRLVFSYMPIKYYLKTTMFAIGQAWYSLHKQSIAVNYKNKYVQAANNREW